MELFFFWLLIGAHTMHGLRVLLFAEALERAKLQADQQRSRFSAATRYLFAGALFLPGFVWAELAWLWLGLAAFTILAGAFALILASGSEYSVATQTLEAADSMISERAHERRVGVIGKAILVMTWIYAWRMHF